MPVATHLTQQDWRVFRDRMQSNAEEILPQPTLVTKDVSHDSKFKPTPIQQAPQ